MTTCSPADVEKQGMIQWFFKQFTTTARRNSKLACFNSHKQGHVICKGKKYLVKLKEKMQFGRDLLHLPWSGKYLLDC